MGKSFTLFLLTGALGVLRAEDASKDPLMKAVAMDAGKISSSEKALFRQSIQTTKETVARETLDVFYRDALDAYRSGRYDEALELLNNIHSVDPYYEDVATLRETITRLKYSSDIESKRGILDEYMRKGNAARQAGRNVQAINFWKQALTVNPSYAPAKRKIQETNRQMARMQYEAGYLNYHKKDYEQALDTWSNAIALDPSLKDRGLLVLMTKIQLTLRKEQTTQLMAQASQFYADHNLPEALQTYEQITSLDPRNDDARRMASKIKIQLGMAAYKAARESLSQQLHAQAIKQWQESIRYGYEVQRSQKSIQEAERQIQTNKQEKVAKRAAKAAEPSADDKAAAEAAQAAAVAQRPPADPEEASKHYRQGLAAIRSKDFHRALQELEIASQLNPDDEHIYVALQRARQEWKALSAAKSLP